MKNNCSSVKMSGDELNATDKELLSFHHWIEESNKDAYKRGLEEAAKIAEGMSFPMQDTANQSVGLPTAGSQVAAAIRAQIQERDE